MVALAWSPISSGEFLRELPHAHRRCMALWISIGIHWFFSPSHTKVRSYGIAAGALRSANVAAEVSVFGRSDRTSATASWAVCPPHRRVRATEGERLREPGTRLCLPDAGGTVEIAACGRESGCYASVSGAASRQNAHQRPSHRRRSQATRCRKFFGEGIRERSIAIVTGSCDGQTASPAADKGS